MTQQQQEQVVDYCSALSEDGLAICRLEYGHEDPHTWTTINRSAPAPSQGCGEVSVKVGDATTLTDAEMHELSGGPIELPVTDNPSTLNRCTQCGGEPMEGVHSYTHFFGYHPYTVASVRSQSGEKPTPPSAAVVAQVWNYLGTKEPEEVAATLASLFRAIADSSAARDQLLTALYEDEEEHTIVLKRLRKILQPAAPSGRGA
ncbi:MAG TPA: hypothetical protein VGP82_06415 [Ktedonobacterales bacterium]|nr:hypothetical protein [Ktedonobacterales bacterium]